MSKFPISVDEDLYDLSPDEISTVISKMYFPAADAESADELISQADLVESVRNALDKVNSKAVFDCMTVIGFESKTIEGTIYWLVLYA